ncbi:hypothetical protein [Sorangium sp. So ce117]|uniref:hypothetical protein n=1 Tax=Sorangium sp. So ce117 TaxID=3133277 RepID=UPI003F62766D
MVGPATRLPRGETLSGTAAERALLAADWRDAGRLSSPLERLERLDRDGLPA